MEGTPSGRRVTMREAALVLGISEEAVRKRVQRDTLPSEMGEDGRRYVWVDVPDEGEPDVVRDELVDELRDRVRFLERELERRGDEADRYQRIIGGLAQANANLAEQVRELEAPPSEREQADLGREGPAEGSSTGEGRGGPEMETSRRWRPWWRRWFG